MKNKTLLSIIPVAMATAANAGMMGEMQPNKSFDGAYIGVSGGVSISQNDNNISSYNYFYTWAGDSFKQENFSLKHGLQSGEAVISLGLGQTLVDNFYVGLEAELSLANNVHQIIKNQKFQQPVGEGFNFPPSLPTITLFLYQMYSNGNFTNNVQAKLNYAEFDLDLRLGSLLEPTTLFYGRVGAAFNHFKLQQNFVTLQQEPYYVDGDPNTVISGAANSSASKTAIGLRLGLGLEHLVTDTISMKLDYIYTWYPSLSTSGVGNVNWIPADESPADPTIVNGISSAISSKINTQAILLGVNWYLDSLFS